MAARRGPDRVRPTRRFLHHLVAKAPRSDQAQLDAVTGLVLPAMTRQQPVVDWIIDDTGIPQKGRHSVGVARQGCPRLGKQDNCLTAVPVLIGTWEGSLPPAWRLSLPKEWAEVRFRPGETKRPRRWSSREARDRDRSVSGGAQSAPAMQGRADRCPLLGQLALSGPARWLGFPV